MNTLIIDDDQIGIFLSTRLLNREGQPTDTINSFVSPVEAVAFLQQQALTDSLPDVVLLDLNMPLLNGWAVLEELKPLEEHLMGRCAIYILSSSLAHSDTTKAQLYPFVAGFLSKPLDSAGIQEIRARHQDALR